MVVPRSANQVASDDEFALIAVATFKKHSAEFLHKCREKRWTPRDYQYKEGGKEQEAKEATQLAQDEKKLWGEALRLGRTGYSESAMIWIHVLALRVFVETVLRYGLPLDFVCGLVQVQNSLPHTSNSTMLIPPRQTPNSPKRQNQTSTPPTPTSVETPLVATAKAVSRRMTRQHQPTCRQRATWVKENTRLTYTTSSRSTKRRVFYFGGRDDMWISRCGVSGLYMSGTDVEITRFNHVPLSLIVTVKSTCISTNKLYRLDSNALDPS
jgi:hypothetical protein